MHVVSGSGSEIVPTGVSGLSAPINSCSPRSVSEKRMLNIESADASVMRGRPRHRASPFTT